MNKLLGCLGRKMNLTSPSAATAIIYSAVILSAGINFRQNVSQRL